MYPGYLWYLHLAEHPPLCGSITCLGRINMHRGRRRERRLRKMGKLHEEKNLQTLGCGVWKIQRSCASEGYACMIMRGFEIRMHCAGPTCARKTRWKKRMITGNVYSGSIWLQAWSVRLNLSRSWKMSIGDPILLCTPLWNSQ